MLSEMPHVSNYTPDSCTPRRRLYNLHTISKILHLLARLTSITLIHQHHIKQIAWNTLPEPFLTAFMTCRRWPSLFNGGGVFSQHSFLPTRHSRWHQDHQAHQYERPFLFGFYVSFTLRSLSIQLQREIITTNVYARCTSSIRPWHLQACSISLTSLDDALFLDAFRRWFNYYSVQTSSKWVHLGIYLLPQSFLIFPEIGT